MRVVRELTAVCLVLSAGCVESPSVALVDASAASESMHPPPRSGGGGQDIDTPCCTQSDPEPDAGTGADCVPHCGPRHELDAGSELALPFVRVAFIGDQAVTEGARAVLSLIEGEGAELVVHAGDFDYRDMPPAFFDQIDSVLDDSVPYIAAVGNHDLQAWEGPYGYQARLAARAAQHPTLECWGDFGVNGACRFMGVTLVLSGVGTLGTGHVEFIDRTFADGLAAARLCVWHKNQRDMQVGSKVDEVGWGAYQACQRAGAFIVTGHAHAYARTYTLGDVGNAALDHGPTGLPDVLDLRPGHTAVTVSALGGHSTRLFNTDHADDPWWANIYTGEWQLVSGALVSQKPFVKFGALFVDFVLSREGGDATGEAHGYFKRVDGVVVDDFELRFR